MLPWSALAVMVSPPSSRDVWRIATSLRARPQRLNGRRFGRGAWQVRPAGRRSPDAALYRVRRPPPRGRFRRKGGTMFKGFREFLMRGNYAYLAILGNDLTGCCSAIGIKFCSITRINRRLSKKLA